MVLTFHLGDRLCITNPAAGPVGVCGKVINLIPGFGTGGYQVNLDNGQTLFIVETMLAAPTSISVTLDNVTYAVGTPLTATIKLIQNARPLVGKTLKISIDGALLQTGTTDANGNVTYTVNVPTGAGQHTISVSYDGL